MTVTMTQSVRKVNKNITSKPHQWEDISEVQTMSKLQCSFLWHPSLVIYLFVKHSTLTTFHFFSSQGCNMSSMESPPSPGSSQLTMEGSSSSQSSNLSLTQSSQPSLTPSSQSTQSSRSSSSQSKVWKLAGGSMHVLSHGKRKPSDNFTVVQLEFSFNNDPTPRKIGKRTFN